MSCLCTIQTLSVLPNKATFIYPKIDPQPSDILDNRTNPEKMQSILRTLNQFLTPSQLEVWNNLVERNLHLSDKFISGITKIKAQITAEIKNFRISQENKNLLTKQAKQINFESLVQKQSTQIKFWFSMCKGLK